MARNILLLIADDLGRDTGYLGNSVAETPNLDRLAENGVSFDQAFSTAATCSASRAAIFTGLYTHQNGHYGHSHWYHHFSTCEHIESAPKIFRNSGYLTAIIGKVHVAPESVYPWEIRQEGFQDNRDVWEMAMAASKVFNSGSSDINSDNRPFFLTVGFGDTHRDHTRKGFANSEYTHVKTKAPLPEDVIIPPCLSDIPEVRMELVEYYESMQRLDQGVGMVLKELELSGHADDTLVVFLSDNGIPFINSKTTLYESGIHLPLFISGPNIKKGIRNPNMVSFIDILPTLLDWAEIDVDRQLRRGRSLLPIIDKNTDQDGWDEVFGSHTFHEVTNYYPTRYYRNRRYKYHKNIVWKTDFSFASDLYASLTWEGIKKSGKNIIGNRPIEQYVHRPFEELYDLSEDPDEVHNLVGNHEYKEMLTSFRAKVEAWQEETEDPWLFKDGVSYRAVKTYIPEGLEIPDRNDMEW